MGKKLTANYIYNLAYQIINLIFPLITTPYVSRILGADGIGVYSYTISIVTYFVLFGSLGISLYGQRQIAFLQTKPKRRTRVLFETLLLKGFTLAIAIGLFVWLFAFKGEYAKYYRILLLYIVANILDISYFFQGMEEFKMIVKRNFAVKLLSIACTFIFVKTENDISNYLLIYALSTLLGNLSLWLWLPKFVAKPDPNEFNVFRHVRPALALFIPQIAVQIYTVLDKVMLGTLLSDKAEVGYYEQSHKIVIIILTVVTSLGTVMMPNIAHKFANKLMDEIKEDIYKSFRFIYLLAFPMMLGIVSIAKDLIPIFLGDGYEASITVLYIISPIVLFIGMSTVSGVQYLLPTLRQTQYTISVSVGAATNLILNLILIPYFKSAGAALATIVAELIVTTLQFAFIRKDFSIIKIIFSSAKYLISGLVMTGCIFLANMLLLASAMPFIRIAVDLIIGGIVYFVMLFVLKDDLLKGFIKGLRDRNAEV